MRCLRVDSRVHALFAKQDDEAPKVRGSGATFSPLLGSLLHSAGTVVSWPMLRIGDRLRLAGRVHACVCVCVCVRV